MKLIKSLSLNLYNPPPFLHPSCLPNKEKDNLKASSLFVWLRWKRLKEQLAQEELQELLGSPRALASGTRRWQTSEHSI